MMNKHTSQRASTACKQHKGFPEDLTALLGWAVNVDVRVIFDVWNPGASIAKQYRW